MFFPNLLDHKCQSDLRNPNQSEFANIRRNVTSSALAITICSIYLCILYIIHIWFTFCFYLKNGLLNFQNMEITFDDKVVILHQ